MSNLVEHLGIASAVPAEENLVGTEDATDGIDRYAQPFTAFQVVLPKLILDKEQHLRLDKMEEETNVGGRVERQVADDISPFPVLADLVARR